MGRESPEPVPHHLEEPAKESGGLYQAVPNYIELPPALTGVPCRIVAMVGKWFPTGCHKVGASFAAWPPGW